MVGSAMTEYAVKEIGHQWIVYADRLSIGACADEDSALKLIAEDSAANSVTRKSTVHGTKASIARLGEPAVRVVAVDVAPRPPKLLHSPTVLPRDSF